jgi:translation initiation factor 1
MVKYRTMPDKNYSRTVYTTETGRICPDCGQPEVSCRCKKKPPAARTSSAPNLPRDGIVRVALERKGRKGSSVSVITGLTGSAEDLKALATELKRRCGTGGTVKDSVIEIQGDHRDTLVEMLKAKGYTTRRAGG